MRIYAGSRAGLQTQKLAAIRGTTAEALWCQWVLVFGLACGLTSGMFLGCPALVKKNCPRWFPLQVPRSGAQADHASGKKIKKVRTTNQTLKSGLEIGPLQEMVIESAPGKRAHKSDLISLFFRKKSENF